MTSRRRLGAGALAAAVLALVGLPALGLPAYYEAFLYLVFHWIALATSWSLLSGYAGYFSFGHGAFFGAGMYTTSSLTAAHGVAFLWTLPLAGAVAGSLAVGIGAVVFRVRRLRGELFGLLTLAIGFVLGTIVLNTPIDGGPGVYLSAVPVPRLVASPTGTFYLLALGLAVATVATAFAVTRSRLGLGLFAIHDDEDVAEVKGVPTFTYKLAAFGLSAAIAGVVGGVHALYVGYVTVGETFSITVPLYVVLMSVLGGARHWLGPAAGATIITVSTHLFLTGDQAVLGRAVVALALILVILLLPAGVLPTLIGWLSARDRKAPLPAIAPCAPDPAALAPGTPAVALAAGRPAVSRPAPAPGTPPVSLSPTAPAAVSLSAPAPATPGASLPTAYPTGPVAGVSPHGPRAVTEAVAAPELAPRAAGLSIVGPGSPRTSDDRGGRADTEGPPVLRCEDIWKPFGGIQALRGVTLDIRPGEILGLVGPNGSGKTTLINVISGHYRADRGSIRLGAERLDGRDGHRIARLGVARTYQIPRPFAGLTVLDNVALAAAFGPAGCDPATARAEARRWLAFTGLAHRAAAPPRELNLHERKFLELARALAAGPRLIMLDEVLSGLNAAEIDSAMRLVRRIRDGGATILFVEHLIRAVVELSDRIVVLDEGGVLITGSPREAMQDPRVVAAYLGKAHARGTPALDRLR